MNNMESQEGLSRCRKFHEARQTETAVTVWGNGLAHRDFLYIKDCVGALHAVMDLGATCIHCRCEK